MISIIKEGNRTPVYVKQYIVDTIADLAALPKDAPHGSSALCLENSVVYLFNGQKQWKEFELAGGDSPTFSLQEKTIDFTANGTYELYPDEGYALSKVTANVNVASESKLPQIVSGVGDFELTASDLAGITQIRTGAFKGSRNLKSIVIPLSVTKIQQAAFEDTSKLVVYYDGGVEDWCKITFDGVYSQPLESYGDGKQIYFKNAAGNYEPVTHIDIPDTITSLPSSKVFHSFKDVVTLTMADSVTDMNSYMFYNCTSLTNVTLSKSLTKLPFSTFSQCESLTSIDFLNDTNITELADFVFADCLGLVSVTIPNQITKLGSNVFIRDENLTSVTVGSGVVTIGGGTFSIGSSTNKATITFLSTTPPSIYSSTFEAKYLNKIIVPAGCSEAYKSATNWANFADYIEEATA